MRPTRADANGGDPAVGADFTAMNARLQQWLLNALKIWSTFGYDSDRKLFHERLQFDGSPVPNVPHRLMVQARQLYVFTHATLTGKIDASERLFATFANVERLYRDPTLPGLWRFSINADGSAADSRCDSYSLAFLLFALAWLYRLRPDEHFLELVDEIYSVLDGPLAASGGGVLDGYPREDAFRRQNPNMHLLEACVQIHVSTGRPGDLRRAEALAALFSRSLVDRQLRAIPELHGEDWLPANGVVAWYEPGHHFEWAWLLRRLKVISNIEFADLVPMLLSRALHEGIDEEGFAIDSVEIASGRKTPSRRSWGTCEFLKLCAAEAEAIPAESEAWRARAARAMSALLSGFLDVPMSGLWYDRVDAVGVPISKDVPASTLYHLALAAMEAERVFATVRRPLTKTAPQRRPALFLDRDGVVNLDVGYPSKPSDICWVEGVDEAIRLANAAGWAVIVVTNQSCVARDLALEVEVIRLNEWMAEQLRLRGAVVDAWYHCPFHKEAKLSLYNHPDHPDRKPNPGMILRAGLDHNIALGSSHMVGDKPTDLQAAARAGVMGHHFDGHGLVALIRSILPSQT